MKSRASVVCRLLVAAMITAVGLRLAAPIPLAEAQEIRATPHNGFGRIVFDWQTPVSYSANVVGSTLVIRFDQPLTSSTATVPTTLPDYVGPPRISNDRRTLSFPLKGAFTARSFRHGRAITVDLVRTSVNRSATTTLVPQPSQTTVADNPTTHPDRSPQDRANPLIRVRTGQHDEYFRVVFDWPQKVPYTLETASDGVLIRFQSAGCIDTATLNANLPAGHKGATAYTSGEQLEVTLPYPAGGSAHAFRRGNSIAVDLRLPGATDPSTTLAPLSTSGDTSFTFPIIWDQPTAAAAFRRGGWVWVVFDDYQPIDIDALRRSAGSHLVFVEQIETQAASTALRMVVPPNVNPSFRREGNTWVLEMRPRPMTPVASLDVIALDTGEGGSGARLSIPLAEAGTPLSFIDPEIGDQIIVVPVNALGSGVYPAALFPDMSVPVTAQGILIEPIRDSIEVRPSSQGIEILAEGGLRLSAAPRVETEQLDEKPPFTNLLDVAAWYGDATMQFPERRVRLKDALVADLRKQAGDRSRQRLALARFQFAHGYALETLGLIQLIQQDDATGRSHDPALRAMEGISHYMLGHRTEALAILGDSNLARYDDIKLWRAAVEISDGGGPEMDAFRRVLASGASLIQSYPPPLRIPLALVAAEAAIDIDDAVSAHALLEAAALSSNTPDQNARRAYLNGRLLELTGDLDSAKTAYLNAEQIGALNWSLRALKHRLSLDQKTGVRTPEQVLPSTDLLEYASYPWQSDEFEYQKLRELKHLYLESGDPGSALRTLQVAALHFSGQKERDEINGEMTRIFEGLYLDGAADSLSLAAAITIWDEFRGLVPADEKGDRMIDRFSDRLVRGDLFGQAAVLLEQKLATRLTSAGPDRARSGARLALLRLLNQQPDQALLALDDTESATLSPILRQERTHLCAQSLVDLELAHEALALLGDDESENALRLRAEIYWKDGNWSEAARQISRLTPLPARGEHLSDEEAATVLDWARALVLSGNEPQVAMLRESYLGSMEETAAYDAFNLITDPNERWDTDSPLINEGEEHAHSFRPFLSEYRRRLKFAPLSSLN